VWTAGHCVTDGPGHDATAFTFVPAYDGAATSTALREPYGRWTYTDVYSTEGWRNSGNFTYDLGAVRVQRADAPGSTLAATVGTRPVAFNYSAEAQQFRSHGYPAAGRFNGQRMFACDSPLKYRDGGAADPMGIACDMTGGSSGGGWIAGGAVASVNSYTYGSLKNVMFGPYQGAVAQSLYATAD
jgi:V8-like Glu-specific endopeptidase